ncbi:hypothetical protein P175DRAFT_0230904 [Aspergillus ochraceoroseus IBT 24754]|uniref:Uncharacterized protein n=1 Tax=Aspergillus ochraceoroseus IBT 24754 TaxID=1392256 RepID=A0A2T5LWT8_9EURO|nr:uncharacterized protein P175DRAFT_0230904 [Aspergillus ochraceoroseus IBT 24754]PTU20754.1 hypothetical protein P175DRAFT_0230904 [Aspergillus ochraceoroseus IBT 24754]
MPPREEVQWTPGSTVSQLKRSKAISHRQGNPLIASLQKELLSYSCDDDDEEGDNDNEEKRKVHRLPKVLTGCMKSGMSTCEIGEYVHGIACRCEPTLTTSTTTTSTSVSVSVSDASDSDSLRRIVRRMIDARSSYQEIGYKVLKILDLRKRIRAPSVDGNRGSGRHRPGSEIQRHQMRGEFAKEEEEEEEDDDDDEEEEGYMIGVAQVVMISVHQAKAVKIR